MSEAIKNSTSKIENIKDLDNTQILSNQLLLKVGEPIYLDFFGLESTPFNITPNVNFVYHSESFTNALNTLIVALSSGEGFVKITGEVGTGKTLLCRNLLEKLNNEAEIYLTAWLPHPMMEQHELLHAIAEEFKINLPENSRSGDFGSLNFMQNMLLELAQQGKIPVLIVDETQAMPDETLEFLRLISNLETAKRKLIHIILFGQPELNDRLNETKFRQLKQRITFSAELKPMTFLDICGYIPHCLKRAGCKHYEVLFDKSALKELEFGSGGIPRLVNILANKSLMVAYGEQQPIVKKSHVKLAIKDTEGANQHGFWDFLKGRK